MPSTGTRTGTSKGGYVDHDLIEDPDGVVAVISKRVHNGELAVGVFRQYDRDGVTEKTAFLPARQIDAAIRVLKIAKDKMEQDADRARQSARQPGALRPGGRR